MIPLSPVQNSSLALKAVQVATSRLETALVKATSFVDKDKARMNLRSALELALGYMEGLSELLELHLISALPLAEIDVLLSRAKESVTSEAGLKTVNILSPLSEPPLNNKGRPC